MKKESDKERLQRLKDELVFLCENISLYSNAEPSDYQKLAQAHQAYLEELKLHTKDGI